MKDEKFSKSIKRSKTNEQYIRKFCSINDLALLLIREQEENPKWNEEYQCFDTETVYYTSDGDYFNHEDDAIEHEIWWLASEITENSVKFFKTIRHVSGTDRKWRTDHV